MIRIGFFLENSPLGFIDYSNIMQGNPGIGGSEFQVILNAYLLSLNSKYKVYLFALIPQHYYKIFFLST